MASARPARWSGLITLVLLSGCSRVCWFGQCIDEGPTPSDTLSSSTDQTPASSTTGSTSLPADCPPDSPHTWETTGSLYLQSYCVGCHSSGYGPGERGGAPLGIDFDTLDDVRAWAVEIEEVSVGDDRTMPPAGGPTPRELADFAEWIRCDLPGSPLTEESLPCDAPESVDAGSVADGCTTPVAVLGDLVVTGDAWNDCLCAVDGTLTVSGEAQLSHLHTVDGSLVFADATLTGPAELPVLLEVTGDLTIAAGSPTLVVLPQLDNVQGELTLTDAPELAALEATRLRYVGGEVTITGMDGLLELDLSSLEEVALGLSVSANLELPSVSLRALRNVGTTISLTDNPSLTEVADWGALETVPGDLVIRDNPSLERLVGFESLKQVGGLMSLSFSDSLTTVSGFGELENVGELIIRQNDVLSSVRAFDTLATLGALRMRSLPALRELRGFGQLEVVTSDLEIDHNRTLETVQLPVREVGALYVHDNASLGELRLDDLSAAVHLEIYRLEALDLLDLKRLENATGDVVLQSLGRLPDLEGLADLTTVSGSLRIDSNPILTGLDGMRDLERVGGDLAVTDNAALPDPAAWAFADTLTILGDVEIHGNGG